MSDVRLVSGSGKKNVAEVDDALRLSTFSTAQSNTT